MQNVVIYLNDIDKHVYINPVYVDDFDWAFTSSSGFGFAFGIELFGSPE